MHVDVDQYRQYSPLVFPLKLKSGMIVTELVSLCSMCGSRLEALRGEVKEYENCSDIKFAGVCQSCHQLVTCRFRRYRDGRIEEERDGRWTMLNRSNWWTRFRSFLRWLFNGRENDYES
jgi:hypothetical protein